MTANHTCQQERDLERLRQMMEEWSDVKRVLNLEPAGDRYRYQIETPFKTFPKFVIGNTDRDMLDVQIEHRCGQQWNSDDFWHRRGEHSQRGELPRVIDIEATVVEDAS